MNENMVNAIIADGNAHDVLPNGVEGNDCAVRDYCLKGKSGSEVTFDCASSHLGLASQSMSKDRGKLDSHPKTVLSDEILDDIYSDMQADQAIMLEQSSIYE